MIAPVDVLSTAGCASHHESHSTLAPDGGYGPEELITRTRNIISAVVTSSGLVAATQGLLGGIAFAIVGIEAPVFWGVLMAFLCLLPLGAAVIWLPASILLAMSGSTTRALILAGLGAGVVSMVDNVYGPSC